MTDPRSDPVSDTPLPDAPPSGFEGDRVAAFRAWLAEVAAAPHRFDFYQVLRHIEAAHPHLPRLGEAARPVDEPVRVGQPAELSFATGALHAVDLGAPVPRLQQRVFGLLGSNGPLPIHLTELVRERLHHHGDATLQRFLDLLTHRFALLFYRAWAQAQPALSLDRPSETGFARRFASLVGIGTEPLSHRDALGDAAKLHFAGRLERQVRDAEGLQAWCRAEFGVPLTLEQWCGHWLPLDTAERTRLQARGGQGLGRGAITGSTVWDVQHKFRLVIGPLSRRRYEAFMPGGTDLFRLQALVRQWVGLEFDWDVRLILRRADVPAPRLAAAVADPASPRLGRSTWIGPYRKTKDPDDLCLDVERALRRRPTPGPVAPARPTAPTPMPA